MGRSPAGAHHQGTGTLELQGEMLLAQKPRGGCVARKEHFRR